MFFDHHNDNNLIMMADGGCLREQALFSTTPSSGEVSAPQDAAEVGKGIGS